MSGSVMSRKTNIQPLMQITFGIALFVIYQITLEPLEIIESKKDTMAYDPGEELSMIFLKWASLIGSIGLILVGSAHLLKRINK